MTRTIAAAVLSLTLSVLPAAAADDSNAANATPTMAVPARMSQSLSRPAALPALYISYAALQGVRCVFDEAGAGTWRA